MPARSPDLAGILVWPLSRANFSNAPAYLFGGLNVNFGVAW